MYIFARNNEWLKRGMIVSVALAVAGCGWIWYQGQVVGHICMLPELGAGKFNQNAMYRAYRKSNLVQDKTPLEALSEKTINGKKLYFIHIPKTAGTSVRNAFHFGPKMWTYKRYNPELDCYYMTTMDHITPQQSVDHGLNTRAEYQENITFAVVRNPYDRILSSYAYMQKEGCLNKSVTLDAFIEIAAAVESSIAETGLMPPRHAVHATAQSRFVYFDDGEQAVTEVLRFESLSEDWQYFVKQYPGFEMPEALPHRNQSKHGRAADVLTTAQKEKIYALYEQDFLNFGYAK